MPKNSDMLVDTCSPQMTQAQTEPKAEGARQQLQTASIADRARQLHAVVISGLTFRTWLDGRAACMTRGGGAGNKVRETRNRAPCKAAYSNPVRVFSAAIVSNILHVHFFLRVIEYSEYTVLIKVAILSQVFLMQKDVK